MYERFTDRARKVMQLANQEAARLNHEYIGTGDILRGLARLGDGVAVKVLRNIGVEPQTVILEIDKCVRPANPADLPNSVRATPRAKKVIEYAMREATDLNHDYVGTEHVLLGLLREHEGLGAQVLMNLGLRVEEVRAEVRATLERAEEEGSAAYSPQSRIHWWKDDSPSRRKDDALFHLRPVDEETKGLVREIAHDLAPLQKAKEEAVARQSFSEAAQLQDRQDQCWRELGNLNLPEWVLTNVKRLASGWPAKPSAFPLLHMLHDEEGEADANVLSILPSPLTPPVRLVVRTVPCFPVSTLKAALPPDDICSPYCQAFVPLISPASIARFKDKHRGWVQLAFAEIRRAAGSIWGRAVLLCVVRPTALSEDVREEVFSGLHKARCDFVVFEAGHQTSGLLDALPSGTKVLGP